MNLEFIADSTGAVRWILWPLCIQTAQTCLESLFHHRLYDDDHLLSWAVLKQDRRFTRYKYLSRHFGVLFRYPNILFVLGLKLALSVSIVWMLVYHRDYSFLVLLMVIFNLLTGLRNGYGDNGSDQLSNIIWFNTGIICLAGNMSFIKDIAIFFIACQASLAYLTAGGYKLISRKWLNGKHLSDIMSTGTFGNPYLKRMADRRYGAYVLLSRLIIGWELLLGLAVVFPPPVCGILLLGGILFHLCVAFAMGFNTFLWAFPASYPAIWLVCYKLHH